MDCSLDERRDSQINQLGLEKRLEMSLHMESNDTKYVSGLSTILVASIQEAKDRISQVEYIFCSQLYPNFQKNSNRIQNLYAEARAVAEDEWKERVSDLRNQLNDVCVEKGRVVIDCEAVKTEKLKLLERVAELEEVLALKEKEVAMLLDLVESKSSVVLTQEKATKEQEEKMNSLLAKLKEQEEKVVALSKDLEVKIVEVSVGKKTEAELIRKIDTQMLNVSSCNQMLSNSEKEKKQLAMKLESMEVNLSRLENELRRKTSEVQDAKQWQEQLAEQVNKNEIDLQKKDQLLSACEKEKQVLLSRISHLENKVEDRQDNHRNGITVIPNANVLAKQLELKKSELAIESQKRRDVVAAYKKLKSQQNFLLKKLGLTSEDMMLQIKAEEASDQSSNDNKTSTPPVCHAEINVKNPVDVFDPERSKVKKEVDSMDNSDDDTGAKLNQMSNSHSPPSSTSLAPTNWIAKKNPGSKSAGIKRPASGWRETRSRPSPGGVDPHDDFLDTPYDNIKGNLIKAVQDNQCDVPTHNSKVPDSGSSDDETQDMRPEPVADRPAQKSPRIGPKGFKYVEPVRKKSERENLEGIECKQCKKFYDAVLGDAEGKDGQVGKQNLRCEHHVGVSRHRYRYAPPMTPEGFWNIGFDTEN
ncbi:hypothetical protein vseg_020551 [Gypsophila vaccaria]